MNSKYLEYLEYLCMPISESEKEIVQELSERRYNPKMRLDDVWICKGLEWRERYFEQSRGSCVMNYPCSMLEMLLALAKDVDDILEWDADLGSRLPEFFWIFVKNMEKFEEKTEQDACRNYQKSIFYDGKNAEKVVKNSIWKQANDYFFE